ncbi:hypothetical protein [Bradyrhizobium sp. LTSPM299]|nr:hypothetical protein [Bradyrhizobium sp. LTSPM299]
MIRVALMMATAVALSTTITPAMANCGDATDTYNSAISDVSDALKR